MGHHATTRKEDISVAVKGFIILLIITFLEVGIALVGNGHIGGMEWPKVIMVPLMILLSLYKAYYIVSIFMHLGHETRPMAASIILPMLLFIWAIIAFLWEGTAWRAKQDYIDVKNQEGMTKDKSSNETTSMIVIDRDKLHTKITFQ